MTSPTQTEPPFVPLRHSGWATRRTPWWVFCALVVVVIGVVAVSLTHRPSQSQRASDLEGYFGDVTTGVGSCAAGLQGSESAYGQVLGGDTAQAKAALSVFAYGGSNCTVASNEALNDFANYQVTESLASLNLDTADNDVITWAFDSDTVQTDMSAVLQAAPGAARASAQSKLAAALGKLDAERSAIDSIWNAAKKATGSGAAFTRLPTWAPPSA
jgi:hypothetical protein